jgi:hypothetical protein
MVSLNSPRYKLINIDFSKPEMVSFNSCRYKLINIDFSKPEMVSLNSPRYKLINIDFSKPEMVSFNSCRYKLINIDFSKPEMISLKYSFVFYSASLLMGHKHFFDFPLLFFVQNLFPRKTFFIFLFFYYIVLYSTLSNIKITQSALHLKKKQKKSNYKKQKAIYRIKLFTDKCETLHMNLAKGKAITKSKNSENGV